MIFGHPEHLLLLWLLPLCIFMVVLGYRRRKARLARFADKRIQDLTGLQWSRGRALIRSGFLLGALGLIMMVLAQPRWGFEWRDVPHGGNDIMVVLDLSQSMMATDISPTRIDRAKHEITDLINMLEGDRLGIVAFAGAAFVQCPLTSDYRLATLFMNQLSPDSMPVQGTRIGDALKLAVKHLRKASSQTTQGKSIILITDGEDQGSNPLEAADQAAEQNVKIFSIGIGGDDGAPIPLAGGGFKKDRQGNVVVSKLGESTLQEITLKTKGTYVRSTTGDLDLENIYRKGIRSDGDATVGMSRQRVWYERFQILLGLALLLLLLEFFWKDFVVVAKPAGSLVRRFWVLLLLVPLFGGTTKGWAQSVKAAEEAFRKKDYPAAAKNFLDAEIEEPNRKEHPYNRGVSQYSSGDYQGAAEGFAKAGQADDPRLAARSLYNLGNSLVMQGDLQKAVQAYEGALQKDPKDKEAKENLEWVKKKLQQQDNKPEQNKKDQDKKDQEKKDQGEDKKDQDKKPDDKNPAQEKKDQDKKPDDKNPEQDKKDQDKPQNGKQDQEPKSSGETGKEQKPMNKDEAERLLRSLEDSTAYGLPPKVDKQDPPEKDW